MKNFLKLSVLFCFLGIFVSCIPILSLNPLYTEKDLIFEPALIGVWSETNSRETWEFTNDGGESYDFIFTDENGEAGRFDAYLVRIQNKMFLDIVPKEPELYENEYYRFHLLPVHSFLYIAQIEPRLQMAMLELDWLKELIEKSPTAIKHEIIDDGILVTASTENLQKLWVEHVDTEDAYSSLSNMVRRK